MFFLNSSSNLERSHWDEKNITLEVEETIE